MNKQDFINNIKDGAIEGYRKYKILPSLTMAQAILESGWGKHHIKNNLFGIKTGSSWKGKVAIKQTKEWDRSKRKYITIEAKFRAYDNFNQSIEDHSKLLGESKRYRKVKEAKNYKEACKYVRECGYVTDPKYTQKLITIIEQNKLYEYDKQVIKTPHWGEKVYKNLVQKGIRFDEKRFDDNLTRAEGFAIADKITDWVMKKLKEVK